MIFKVNVIVIAFFLSATLVQDEPGCYCADSFTNSGVRANCFDLFFMLYPYFSADWQKNKYSTGNTSGYKKSFSSEEKIILRDTCIGKLLNGLKEGMWRCTDHGNIHEIFYHQGQKNGIWKTYTKTGELISEKQYIRDTLHGVWIKYQNGTVESVSIVNKGELTYESEYYPDGSLRACGAYTTGEVKITAIFFEGPNLEEKEREIVQWDWVKDGTWKYYAEDGRLIKIEVYQIGKLVKTEEY